MRRIIMVAFKDKPELDAAVRAFKTGAASALGAVAARDIYAYIKAHLGNRGVAHADKHMHPDDVPAGHAYFHS